MKKTSSVSVEPADLGIASPIRSRGLRVRHLGALLLVAGCALSTSSCANKPVSASAEEAGAVADSPQDAASPRSIRELRRAAKAGSQPKSPSNLPPPPGIDATRLTPFTAQELAANPNALRSLEEVTPELASKVSLAKANDPPADDAAKEEALRLYVSGRSALLAGDATQAQVLLTDAAGKNPAEAGVWRELGEAQMRLGRRTLAVSSFTQAARRGLDEARVWLMLGRDAVQKSDMARGAAYLSRARSAPDADADTALKYIIDAELGAALAQLGYAKAAELALDSAASLPDSFSENTNFRGELGEVYRRRGELFEQSGDLAMRLNDSATAMDRYEQAAGLPSLDPGASLVRFVYASALRGAPERGAEALLTQIIEADGWIEDRQLLLIRYLAANTPIGPALSRALAVLPEDLKTPPTRTIHSRLVRAQAASDPAGAKLLRAYLSSHPGDSEASADLIALVSGSGNAEAREVLALTETSPAVAVRVADAVVGEGRGLEACRDGIARGARSPGQRAALAWLENRMGDSEHSYATARLINADSLKDPQARAVVLGVVLRAQLDAGDFAGARATIDALKSQDGPAFSVRAASLLDAGEDAFVAQKARELSIDALPADADERIATAEILARAGRAPEAEKMLEAVLAEDRFDERAYRALITLYLPTGPLKDDAKLGAVSRRLRDAIPSSRVIRWLAAGELAQRQLWGQVEAALVSLAEEGSPEPAMMGQLLVAWERQTTGDLETRKAVLTRAETWLRAKLARHPDSVELGASLARVMELQGRGEEAEAALSALLRSSPIPAVARQREQLVRVTLKQPERAKQLALKRLDHLPRSIDESLELAELRALDSDAEQTAIAIAAGLPPSAPMNPGQRDRLIALLNQQVGAAIKDEKGQNALAALRLISAALDAGVELPKPLHEARLTLLATNTPGDTRALLDAAALEARLFPDGSTLVIARTADRISKSAKPSNAPGFLRAAIGSIQQPTTELYQYLAYLTARYGTIEDVRGFAALIDDPSKATIVTELASTPGEDIPSSQAGRVTEVIYLLGNEATRQGRPEFTNEIYRYVLEREPRHAMTCNNLAYHLLETGADLGEVDRLLMIAYSQRPETSAILDSLGWLRYKQGRLRDEKDGSGNVTDPGAVSLLLRATEARDAQDNAVIVDHLGDAYWAAGDHQRARDSWELARVSAKRTIEGAQLIRAQRNAGEDDEGFRAQLAEFRAVVTQTELKLKAVADSKEPPIAAHAPIVR